MRKPLLFASLILGLAVMLLAAAGVGAYRATQQVPDFYQQALQQPTYDSEEAGDRLEQQMFELHNDARKEGHWEAVFTDEQINGWLAADLPDKFPHMLPKGVQDPRVALDSEAARIACRYDSPKLSAVISLELEVQLTEEPNVVAVRVESARAGALPLPLRNFLDHITRVARRNDIMLRWKQIDGDPVALVTIPSDHEDYKHQVFLESLELRDGEVYLAGRTEAGDHSRATVAQHSTIYHAAVRVMR